MEAISEMTRESRVVEVEVEVTGESTIQLQYPGVGLQFSGVEVDVYGHVEEVPFILYVTYEGRRVPAELEAPVIERSGIVELRVDELRQIFRDQKEGGYLKALETFIEETTSGKSWIHHPRLPGAILEAEKLLANRILDHEKYEEAAEAVGPGSLSGFAISKLITEGVSMSARQAITKNYECIMCKSNWLDTSPICVKCDTHLYTREV